MNVLSYDANLFVRARIVECLGDIDQPSNDIVQALLKALHDTDDHVRSCAVKSLGHIAHTSSEVLATLIFALRNDTFFGVRWEVVRSLEHLEKLPTIAVPAIVQALTDENWAVREDCSRLLGQGGSSDEKTIQALITGLSDTEMLVRRACSQALVQLGQRFPESIETITIKLARIVQEQKNDTTYRFGYGASFDVAYDALRLLINDGPFE
jgi:HEAT repeat protein